MELNRPLCFLDLEGTGLDTQKDRIIEMGVCVLSPSGARSQWSGRFYPEMNLSVEITALTGITDDDLRGAPPFKDMAAKIHRGLSGKDLAGYNLRRYDLPLLDEEFRRCGLRLDLEGVHVIDCAGIFHKREPRKLADAVRRYCGRELDGAHGALADATATADVLLGQLASYEDLRAMDLGQLAVASRLSEFPEADIAGRLYWDADGNMRYGFGKARGQRVQDDVGFGRWILKKDFPESTKEALLTELRRLKVAYID